KRNLKRILGVFDVPRDAAADAENHRSMAAHEQFKRRLIALGDKARQQIGVGCFRRALSDRMQNEPHYVVVASGGHLTLPSSPIICARRADFFHEFSPNSRKLIVVGSPVNPTQTQANLSSICYHCGLMDASQAVISLDTPKSLAPPADSWELRNGGGEAD